MLIFHTHTHTHTHIHVHPPLYTLAHHIQCLEGISSYDFCCCCNIMFIFSATYIQFQWLPRKRYFLMVLLTISCMGVCVYMCIYFENLKTLQNIRVLHIKQNAFKKLTKTTVTLRRLRNIAAYIHTSIHIYTSVDTKTHEKVS